MSESNKKKRHHLGVLFGTLDDMSQYILFNGINEYAKKNDIHLTAYFGAYMAQYRDLSSHYEMCLESIKHSDSLDGLILFSGYITTDMSIDAYMQYLARLPKDLPLVSVSFLIEGIPGIMIDNAKGMYTTVEHLIKTHNKRKIVFIRGPEGHFEAEQRLNGYKAALDEYGIEYDERYVLPGNFTGPCGTKAAIELLDNRKIPFDAIVASNDAMAASAMEELISRGIKVHEDVAVTGFDDDIIALRSKPMLSTMRQDFFELGMKAAQVLYDSINNRPVKEVYHLPPDFIPRQSCGCFEKELFEREGEDEDYRKIDINTAESMQSYAMSKILPLFRDTVPYGVKEEWVTGLTQIIKANPFSRGKLLYYLYSAMDEHKRYSDDMRVWSEVLLELKECVLRFENEVAHLRSSLAALVLAMKMVGDARIMRRQNKDFDASDFRANISKVTSALTLSFDTDVLAEEMCKSLPNINLDTALVCLYPNPVISEEKDADRGFETILGYDGSNKYNVKCSMLGRIAPHDYTGIVGFEFNRERRTFFYLPLFFMKMELGAAILPYDARIPVEAYDTLRIDISTAVKGAELMSKIQALSTLDELTGLLNRRGFFHYAQSNLQHLDREIEPVIPIILFIDMDNLKGINDTYGHKEGDTAITAFANILKEVTRRVDVVGRIGGDEFVVFSSVKNKANINQLKIRMQDKLRKYNEQKLHPYNLGCSIGSAILDDLTMDALDAAIAAADNLLYEEKAQKKQKRASN